MRSGSADAPPARSAAGRAVGGVVAALLSVLAFAPPPALTQIPVTTAPPSGPEATLPAGYWNGLRAAGVPVSAASVVVRPVEDLGVSARSNETVPMNPASTMKLLTTYAGLDLLGPAFTWKTEAFALGPLSGSVLDGGLGLRGSGDPGFVVEQLWLLLQRLRALGIREIRGDLVLDKSVFGDMTFDPALFDGEGLRAYNTGPDALLLNYKVVAFSFVPDPVARLVRVVAIPPLAGMRVPARVRAADGPCGDWRSRLRSDFGDPLAPRFDGAFPLSCGERTLFVSMLEHAPYFGAAFRAVWESMGGRWTGQVREGRVPPDSLRLALHESQPLSQVIRDINKFSNNVMTRQLFLTLAAQAVPEPATNEAATAQVRAWLASRGIEVPELVLENGSGLSRVERISAANLARLLIDAWRSPYMPELMASLPIAGVDGTVRRRNVAVGYAHVKTGLLNDVRAIAGYVLAQSGRRYVVVAIINHPNAGRAQAAHDSLLDWLYRTG